MEPKTIGLKLVQMTFNTLLPNRVMANTDAIQEAIAILRESSDELYEVASRIDKPSVRLAQKVTKDIEKLEKRVESYINLCTASEQYFMMRVNVAQAIWGICLPIGILAYAIGTLYTSMKG